jgi:hypothetical protein
LLGCQTRNREKATPIAVPFKSKEKGKLLKGELKCIKGLTWWRLRMMREADLCR